MGADLTDTAVVEHNDLGGLGNRVQSVGDDKHRPTRGESVQCLLNEVLRLGVGECRRLIEHQHRSVGQDCSGDREPLPLSAGQCRIRAEHGVIALR